VRALALAAAVLAVIAAAVLLAVVRQSSAAIGSLRASLESARHLGRRRSVVVRLRRPGETRA
jgi:hypothetical protein